MLKKRARVFEPEHDVRLFALRAYIRNPVKLADPRVASRFAACRNVAYAVKIGRKVDSFEQRRAGDKSAFDGVG